MAIEMTCPGCDTVYPVSDELIGKTIRCKKCGEMMSVTAAGVAKPTAGKPTVAKAIPAKPARATARVNDDEFDDSTSRNRSGREQPVKKKSPLPLIAGGLLGLLLLGGGGMAALVIFGQLDRKADTTAENPVALNNQPSPNGAGPIVGDGTTVSAPIKQTGNDAKALTDTDKTTPAETPEPDGPKDDNGKKPALLPTPLQPLKTPDGDKPAVKAPPGNRNTPDQLALTRAKTAAVFIECETASVKASGSGWFGMEDNLVFTNAHVLSMKNPGSQKPKKLTIYINPGTNQERIIPHARIEILAVDREADLAVLKITNETNLPIPLKIRPSRELNDLEPLVVIGYPGGRLMSRMNNSTRAPQATVNTTSFSTNRINDDGELYSVQIRGGAGPGNSGGPIIDYDGNVVAVLVRGPSNAVFAASVCYGVPTEYVSGLMAGRVSEIEYGQAYRKGGKIRIPVSATVLDPFQRMKEVGIGVWVGDPSTKKRAPGAERTGVEPADSDFQEVKLEYKYTKDKQVATGEIVYPDQQSGRAYWAQPYYSNGIVPKYWMPGGNVKLSGPPVDLDEVDLLVRYKRGSKRAVTLTTSSDLDEFEVGEGAEKNERVLLETEITATESVLASPESASVALLQVNYDKLNLKATAGDDKEDILARLLPKPQREALAQSIKLVQGFGFVKANGEIYKTRSDLRGAPQYAALFSKFSNDAMEALQNASIPLPNGKVKPQQKWTGTDKIVRFAIGYAAEEPKGANTPPPADEGGIPGTGPGRKIRKVNEYKYVEQLTYTYLGTRTRIGQKEAVIRIEGVIKPAPGSSVAGGANGLLKGYAYIDLDTGTVLESELHREFEMDSSSDGVKKMVSGVNNYKVTRGSASGQ